MTVKLEWSAMDRLDQQPGIEMLRWAGHVNGSEVQGYLPFGINVDTEAAGRASLPIDNSLPSQSHVRVLFARFNPTISGSWYVFSNVDDDRIEPATPALVSVRVWMWLLLFD